MVPFSQAISTQTLLRTPSPMTQGVRNAQPRTKSMVGVRHVTPPARPQLRALVTQSLTAPSLVPLTSCKFPILFNIWNLNGFISLKLKGKFLLNHLFNFVICKLEFHQSWHHSSCKKN